MLPLYVYTINAAKSSYTCLKQLPPITDDGEQVEADLAGRVALNTFSNERPDPLQPVVLFIIEL